MLGAVAGTSGAVEGSLQMSKPECSTIRWLCGTVLVFICIWSVLFLIIFSASLYLAIFVHPLSFAGSALDLPVFFITYSFVLLYLSTGALNAKCHGSLSQKGRQQLNKQVEAI